MKFFPLFLLGSRVLRVLIMVMASIGYATSFASNKWMDNTNRSLSPTGFREERTIRTTGITAVSKKLEEFKTINNLLVISWERCLADTVRWRSETALAAARRVWPALYDTFCSDNHNAMDWLFQKLQAIHHVLDGPAEYGLAVRLILEEQLLDGGQSNGSIGKYASLFHPQSHHNQNVGVQDERQGHQYRRASKRNSSSSSRTRTRTRPLTVGEITAHWRADLCDTLRFRYGPPDPVALLEEATREIILTKHHRHDDDDDDNNNDSSSTPSLICKDLLPTNKDSSAPITVVTVQSDADLAVASASLNDAGIDHIIVDKVDSLLQDQQSHIPDRISVHLVLDKGKCETVKRLRDLVPLAKIQCVEASYRRLESYISLCGDDAHHRNNNASSSSSLRLMMADWAAHPDELAAAIMNPWMDPVKLGQLQYGVNEPYC